MWVRIRIRTSSSMNYLFLVSSSLYMKPNGQPFFRMSINEVNCGKRQEKVVKKCDAIMGDFTWSPSQENHGLPS